jgi:hypothetical protein
MKNGKGGEPNRPPRGIRGFPLESPEYEEEVDPYFVDPLEQSVDGQDQLIPSDEEDWYWREPDNYWLEEGVWPWPPTRAKRDDQEPPPESQSLFCIRIYQDPKLTRWIFGPLMRGPFHA